MSKPKPGDVVTCLHAVEAYGSNYGPNKGNYMMFKPGMMGTVKSIAPKVTMSGNDDPRYDMKITSTNTTTNNVSDCITAIPR